MAFFTNIKWDTTDSGSEEDYSPKDAEALGLPTEVELEVPEGTEPADALSDYYNYCVFSFEIKSN